MIVDAEKGLAVISRSVIPFDLGILNLTFAKSVVIPGKVSWPLVLKLRGVGRVLASNVGHCFYFLGSKTLGEYTNQKRPARN